jgi:hypothetical protein
LRGAGYSLDARTMGIQEKMQKLVKARRTEADKSELILSVVKAGRALHDVSKKDTGLSTKRRDSTW